MKITCRLKAWAKEKKQRDTFYIEVELYDIHHYENNKVFDIKYELQIVSLGKKNIEIEILKRVEIVPEEKKQFHIYYHTIDYMYSSDSKTILCTSLIQKI